MPFLSALTKNVLDGASLGPAFPLRHVSKWMGRQHHTATIPRVGKFTFRTNLTDASTLVDIFRHRTYDLSRLKQYDRVIERYKRILSSGRSPLIIDAGANVGAASLWFSQTFPEARICAIEPDPHNVEMLHLNMGQRRNVEVIAAAIGSEAGKVSLKNETGQADAVQTERDASGSVQMMTIPDVLARNDETDVLFLVKVDIEGFEADLFSKNLGWLDGVEVVIVEPHDWLFPGAGTSRAFQKAMLERDFEMVISGENLVYLRV